MMHANSSIQGHEADSGDSWSFVEGSHLSLARAPRDTVETTPLVFFNIVACSLGRAA